MYGVLYGFLSIHQNNVKYDNSFTIKIIKDLAFNLFGRNGSQIIWNSVQNCPAFNNFDIAARKGIPLQPLDIVKCWNSIVFSKVFHEN